MLVALTAAAGSKAALVSVQASADMTSGFDLATDLLPIGTTVTSDLIFDIGPGTIQTSNIGNVSGSFNWVDAALGAQSFNADSARITTRNSAGWYQLLFSGNGPTINGLTVVNFEIRFDIGTNPFSPPGSTAQLFDLTLNSTIERLRVYVSEGPRTVTGELLDNVSGSVSEVPVPGALLLFATGLLGIYASRRKSPGAT